jgi:amino acid transporter
MSLPHHCQHFATSIVHVVTTMLLRCCAIPPPTTHQVRRPSRDLPLGILGALFVVTTCYMLMSAVLVTMVPLDQIDTGAAFAAAFGYVGGCGGVLMVAILFERVSAHCAAAPTSCHDAAMTDAAKRCRQ